MSEALPAMTLDASTVNLACFEVRQQSYALEVAHVLEIVRVQPITLLPNTPELIERVVDLSGAVIPVLDLGRVLNRGVTDDSFNARIVVLEFDGLVLELLVDAATDILTLDVSRLEDVPDLASHAGYEAVRHVVRRDGEPPVKVLALEFLVESVCPSALRAGVAEGEGR